MTSSSISVRVDYDYATISTLMNKSFWDVICAALPAFVLLFVLDIVLFIFLAASVLFVEPGSAAYYASLLSSGLLTILFVGSVFVIRRCRRRE